MTPTPFKPDLVALAEQPSDILERVLSGKTLRLRCGNHLIERNLATGHVEMTPAFARALLNELASQPSLYEAGLRDMRERCEQLARSPRFAKVDHISVTKGPNWTEETGMAALVSSHARCIAAAISALPADGGEKSSEGGCICQGQHRRGYCTEPGCPYSLSDTTRPALSVAVKVKALAWRNHRPDSFPEPAWSAETPFGFYHIEEVSASDSPAYVVRLHANHFIADKDSLEEAKAAAQADYETRVRSCISTTSVDDGVVRVLSELRDRRLLNDVDDGLHEEIAESLIKAVRG